MGFYDRPRYNWYDKETNPPTTRAPATRRLNELPEDAVQINEFPMYYITPRGEIYNSRHQQLTNSVDTKGYLKIALYKDNQRYTRRVHVMVAQQFLPVPADLANENNLVVDHIDQDRTNCSVNNLQWVSQKDNIKKAYEQGRVQSTSIRVKCVEDDIEFFSCTQAALHYGLSKVTVHQAIEQRDGYVAKIDRHFKYV